MNYLDWLIFAMTKPSEEGGGGGLISLAFPLILIFVLYYFLLHMPQKKKQQERQKMLEAMKRGDEVITSGGIYGRVTAVTDKVVTMEIAPKIRIRVAKAQVTGITSPGGEEDKGKDKEKEKDK
jgi:preprotein translocase subunit YajC